MALSQEAGMDVARTVARNSAVQLAGRGLTMVVSLGTLTLLARYLGPEDFGQYQLIIAILFLVNVADFGMATVATRHLISGQHDPDDLMGNVVTIRLAIGAGAAVIAVAAAILLNYDSEVRLAMAVASLSFILMVFSGSYYAAFNANLRMEYAVAGSVAQAVVTISGMGIAVLLDGGLLGLMIAYNAGFAASSAVSYFFARRFIRPHFAFDRTYSRLLISDAMPLMVAGLVINAYARIDLILLKIFATPNSVGHYSFAYRFIDMAAPLSFLFVSSVYPLLSDYHARGDMASFKRLYQRSHDFLSLAGLTLATGVILFAPHIVEILGGGEYYGAATTMRVLAMTFALIWLTNLVNHSLIAVGKQHVLLWTAVLGLAVNVSVNLFMIPTYGKEGAAATQALTEATILVASLVILSRYMGEAPSFWVAGRLLPVAGVASIAVYALPFPWLTEVLLTGVLFGSGIALVRIVSLRELRELLHHREPPDAAATAVKVSP